ncbi:MAG: galactonate dehydratase [Anaerolineae bacterium]|nr:galactonate dehydratase [Anaerolineae bacterium]
MKITKIETFVAYAGWNNHTYVKVHTDEGIHGIGQAYSAGPDEAVVQVIHDFESWLTGQDPRNIEHLVALMYNGSRFPPGVVVGGAMSGIEHALWDIKGKALGVPVYELLGGKCRDRVRVYSAPGGDTPEALAESALRLVERYGFTALKIGPQPSGYAAMPENALVRAAAQRMEAVRKAVGPDVDIGVDPHARIFEPVRALQMIEALKPYQPFFVEEPIRPENVDALAALHAKTTVPIATGESLYTKFQFNSLLVHQAADIIQPDICIVGGLLEMKKIAAMAEGFYVSVVPHNPMGPVATAVNVHFAASTPNFVILEYTPDDKPPRRDVVKEPVVLKDGYLELPTAPGLGIELNEEAFARYPSRRWHRPFPFRADGSMGFI